MIGTESLKNGQGLRVGLLLKGIPQPGNWDSGCIPDGHGSGRVSVASGGPRRREPLTDSEKGCISGLLSAAELKHVVKMRSCTDFGQRRPQISPSELYLFPGVAY